MAVPTATGKHPGLVVIHELFGVTPWIREVADQFAAKGYLALAPDLFGGRIHLDFTPEAAQRMLPRVWAQPVEVRIVPEALKKALRAEGHKGDDLEIALRLAQLGQGLEWMPPMLGDLRTAVATLKRHPRSTGKVGGIGFCFGGKMSFHLATVEPTLDAAVVFYGAGPREAEIERIKCPVLGIYGEDDEHVTKDVPRIQAAMARFNKPFEVEIFNRTGHAFARTGSSGFKEEAAKRAWARTDAFLAKAIG